MERAERIIALCVGLAFSGLLVPILWLMLGAHAGHRRPALRQGVAPGHRPPSHREPVAHVAGGGRRSAGRAGPPTGANGQRRGRRRAGTRP